MNSQTIGNQTSSSCRASQDRLPLQHESPPMKFGIHVTGIHKGNMHSQTIGNQTSSFRRASQDRLPIHYHKSPPMKFGIHVTGIPFTKKVDRMEQFMDSDKAPHRRSGNLGKWSDAKFYLHYYQWYAGKETTGEGVYTFNKDADLVKLSKLLDGTRIDKKNEPIRTCVVPICFNCRFPLDCKDTPIQLLKNNLEKASTLCGPLCELCLPSPVHCCCCDTILTENDGLSEFAKPMKNYACRACWANSEVQEKWRYNEQNKQVNATSSSYVEELYLSDEAIEREKQLMGGVHPKPCKDTTPFLETFHIRNLIDPESRDYWPFGMNAQQYLEHKEIMRFNNPLEETPDETWKEIDVNEEGKKKNHQDLQGAFKKFNKSKEHRE